MVQMKNIKFLQLIAIFCSILLCFSGCASAKKAERPDFPLAGTLWAPVTGPSGAVLEFTPDHRIVGTTNGNRFFAPIEKIDGHLLNFGSIAITRAMSAEPEKEAIFIDALDRTRAWRVEGNILILENERKRPLLKLRRLVIRKSKKQ